MVEEIKLKYYNENLEIGFNDWRKVHCTKTNCWIEADYHLGRLVYGKKRIPYKKIVKNITHRNYLAVEFIPF